MLILIFDLDQTFSDLPNLWIEQARLCAIWTTENLLGSSMNHLQGWMTVWECYCHGIEIRCLIKQEFGFWAQSERIIKSKLFLTKIPLCCLAAVQEEPGGPEVLCQGGKAVLPQPRQRLRSVTRSLLATGHKRRRVSFVKRVLVIVALLDDSPLYAPLVHFLPQNSALPSLF